MVVDLSSFNACSSACVWMCMQYTLSAWWRRIQIGYGYTNTSKYTNITEKTAAAPAREKNASCICAAKF